MSGTPDRIPGRRLPVRLGDTPAEDPDPQTTAAADPSNTGQGTLSGTPVTPPARRRHRRPAEHPTSRHPPSHGYPPPQADVADSHWLNTAPGELGEAPVNAFSAGCFGAVGRGARLRGGVGGVPDVIFGQRRHHGGSIVDENRRRSPVAGSSRRSLTWGVVASTVPVAASRGELPRRVIRSW